MIRRLTVLSSLFIICGWSASSASTMLTTEGLGPVLIGMTVAQAEKALGAKFDPEPGNDQGCWYTQPSRNSNPGVHYYIDSGRVFLIEIKGQDERGDLIAKPDVITPKGIQLGSPIEDVSREYGEDVIRKKYFENQPDYDIYIVSSDNKRAIKILVDNNSVYALFVGTFISFQFLEPCPD